MSTTPPPSNPGRKMLYTLLIVVFLTPITLNIYDHFTRRSNALPGEKSVILQLLAEKFTGPEYFQADESSAQQPLAAERVYISATSAKTQTQRITTARKLSAEKIATLNSFIERMTEPSPSRAVGQERVNLLLLNMTLDTIK